MVRDKKGVSRGETARQGMDMKWFIKVQQEEFSFRTQDNYSALTFGRSQNTFWGKCRPECNGETPSPDSPYNLAKDSEDFKSAWSYGLYNLKDWESGFCYTYDPPQKSERGVSNGLYILLGHNHLLNWNPTKWDAKDSHVFTYSFDIYLHEKVKQKYKKE